jgi:cell division protein FtsB
MLRIAHTTSVRMIVVFTWCHAHIHDTEFAFEIGSSLLTEVRRLQSLIAERDKALQDLNEENQDLRNAVEDLKSGLETHKSTAGK